MPLTKKDIAEAGLRLLDRVGLEGLTVRAIAQELGVKAPALYWHLENKQALLDEVATQMYLTHMKPLPPSRGGWTDRLHRRARDLRRMMLSYRDGAKVFSGTFFTEATLPGESEMEEMVTAGLTPRQAVRVLSAVFSFTVGFTIEQQAVEPIPGERDKRYDVALARPGRSYAATAAIRAALHDSFDKQFEDGLKIVFLGVKAWLPPSAV